MVIGLKHGKTRAGDDEARERTYGLAKELARRFKERNRSIVCRELLGYDLSIEEDREAAIEQNLFYTLCPRFVCDAGQILEDLLGK